MKKLYLDDFKDKKTWINVCKMFDIILDQDLRCSKTNYIIQEIRFTSTKIEFV